MLNPAHELRSVRGVPCVLAATGRMFIIMKEQIQVLVVGVVANTGNTAVCLPCYVHTKYRANSPANWACFEMRWYLETEPKVEGEGEGEGGGEGEGEVGGEGERFRAIGLGLGLGLRLGTGLGLGLGLG